jgi:hypothetical protein
MTSNESEAVSRVSVRGHVEQRQMGMARGGDEALAVFLELRIIDHDRQRPLRIVLGWLGRRIAQRQQQAARMGDQRKAAISPFTSVSFCASPPAGRAAISGLLVLATLRKERDGLAIRTERGRAGALFAVCQLQRGRPARSASQITDRRLSVFTSASLTT